MTRIKSKGRIKTWRELSNYEKQNNRIIVMWEDQQPSVLMWFNDSWRDIYGRGYTLDLSYPLYRVDDTLLDMV